MNCTFCRLPVPKHDEHIGAICAACDMGYGHNQSSPVPDIQMLWQVAEAFYREAPLGDGVPDSTVLAYGRLGRVLRHISSKWPGLGPRFDFPDQGAQENSFQV